METRPLGGENREKCGLDPFGSDQTPLTRLWCHTVLVLALCATGFGQTLDDLIPGGDQGRGRARGQGEFEPTTAWSLTGVHPGGQIVLAVVLDVSSPLHINTSTAEQPLIPTVVRVAAEDDSLTFLEPQYPAGEAVTVNYAVGQEQAVGDGAASQTIEAYHGRVVTYIGVTVDAAAPVGGRAIPLEVSWQACDESRCFRPRSRTILVNLEVVDRSQAVDIVNADLFAGFDATIFIRPTTMDAHYSLFGSPFATGSTLLIILMALAAGVVLNFTPCVLPVVPLKVMSLQQHASSRGRRLALGASFSLGIVICFALLGLLAFGLVAGVGSKQWGQLFSYWWFAAGLGTIVGAMGLGMMGLFATRLPQFVYAIAPRQDRHSGSFLFGMLTAILSTPCTGPFLAGSMGWAVKQPAVLGLLTFVSIGVGMALPYMLLLLVPRWIERIPRSGPASALIKQLMGLLLLAVATYFFGFAGKPVWEGHYWWAVAAVIFVAMSWLVARTWAVTPRWWPRMTTAVIAVLLMFGTAWVAAHRAIDHVAGGPWTEYNTALFNESIAANKKVVLEFTADWCINCLALESQVLRDREVVERLESQDVVALRVDLTSDANLVGWRKLDDLGFTGIPLTAVYRPESAGPALLPSFYTVAALLEAIGP